MADDPFRVPAVFTGNGQTSDVLEVRGVGLQRVHTHLREDVATWAATVVLEMREPGETPWHVKATDVIAGGALVDRVTNFVGSWDFRLRVTAYTGGTGGAFLKRATASAN